MELLAVKAAADRPRPRGDRRARLRRPLPRRPVAAAPGRRQPARQRDQVHRPRQRRACASRRSRSRPRRRRVRLEVTDTGIGMTPDGLARLFRPFAQAEDVDDAAVRRHRPRPDHLEADRRADGRRHRRRQRARPRQHVLVRDPVPAQHGAAAAAGARPARRRRAGARAARRQRRGARAPADRARRARDAGRRPPATASARSTPGPAGFAVAFVSVDAIDAAPFVDALQQHPSRAPAPRSPRSCRPAAAARHRPRSPRLVPSPDAPAAARPAGRVPGRIADGVAGTRGAASTASIATPVPAAAVARRRPAAVAPGRRRAILVADDYFANQRLVTRLLEKRGYIVEAVGDGQAAVDAVLDRALRRRADGLQHAGPRRLRGDGAHPRPRAAAGARRSWR